MEQPQLIVVDPPAPGSVARNSGPPYSGPRQVRESFLRGLLGCDKIERVLILTPRRDAAEWNAALREHQSACEAMAVTIDTLRDQRMGENVVVTPMQTDLNASIHLRQILRQPSWPVVGMTHDLSHPTFFHALLLAQLSGLRVGDAIACCSTAAKSALEQLYAHARRLAGISGEALAFPIIPHGMEFRSDRQPLRHEARAQLSIAADGPFLLYFGRISRSAKADLPGLIRAFASCDLPAAANLVIAGGVGGCGDLDCLDGLRRTANDLGIQDRVSFFANRDEKKKHLIYSGADVFVSPANSFQESFGIALLEAMSYSLPIVASDWNGYRDIVDHGTTGFLAGTTLAEDIDAQLLELPFCDPGQLHDRLSANVRIDFQEFGAAMAKLAGDPALRVRLGRAGHDRLVRNFTLDGVILRYTSLWMELCDKARRHPDRALGRSSFVDYTRVFAGHPSIVADQSLSGSSEE